jgi:hypothetical protein
VNSGLFDYSSTLNVSSVFCGCQPAFTTGTSNGYFISNVVLENSGLSNASGATASAPFYQYFTTLAPGIIQRGAPYWLAVTPGTNAGTHNIGAWIDWNADNDFNDAGEQVGMQATSNSQPVYFLINVPVTANLGLVRMRVRASNTTNALDACLSTGVNYVNGESEDYNLTIEPSSCLNATLPGTITTILPTEQAVNGEIDITEDPGVGTRIGWEYSADNFTTSLGTYITYPNKAIINVNPSSPYLYVRGVYQNGGCPVAYSNVALVKLRCASSFGTTTNTFDNNDVISNVRINDGATILLNNPSLTINKPVGYQDFRSISTPLNRGKTYQMVVNMNQNAVNKPLQVAVWLDYDVDGEFSTTELLYKSSSAAQVHTFNITIPCSSVDPDDNITGEATMRVMCVDSTSAINSITCWNKNASTMNTYRRGELEEYTIFLMPLPSLTVTPPNAVCTGITNTLTASGGTGTYTWVPATGLSQTSGSAVVATTGGDVVFYTVTGQLSGTSCAANAIVPVASLPKGGNVTPASSVICTGGTRLLTNVGGVGFFQWQISTDNISFTDIAGATANTYLTTAGNGNSLKYYRCISIANNCFSVSSTTAVVSISATPVVSFTSVTSTTATVTWSPFGSGQYNISWTGAGSGSAAAVTTNNYTITGLTPNTNLNVTVSLASPVCGGTSPGVASVKTLCAKPTITSLVNATDALGNPGFKVNWNAVAGATTYRVYWRNMQLGAGWSFIDTVGTTKTLTSAAASTLYAGNTIAVYVAVNNCPSNATALGDASSISYVTLNPVNSCPIPTFTAVSNCPNQMSVTGLSGSPTGNYEVRFRRIFPTQTAGVAYSISSPSINLSIGSSLAGSIWEIYVRSLCTGNVYSPNATVQLVEVKPACSAISNPIMSTINCLGGTFSWNESNCIGVLGYYINIKKTTETAYNAYPVGANYFRVINWLSPNTAYNIFAQSVSCNGYLSPASPIVTFTTGGPGCREDEAGEIVESVSPKGEGINVFPNPSTGNFSVAINSSDLSDQEVRIEVMNALGQSLVTQISNMSGGNLIEGIQLDNAVASGVYFVRVHVGTNVYVNRLVLNRD